MLRFNHAPTKGFEDDVGSKTTIRILNSQVVSKPKFKFLSSELYRNVTILAWDPSNYSSPIHSWLKKPDYDLFTNYMLFKKQFPKSRLYLLNPQSLWDLWDYLQSNSPGRLRRNPPSSGFLGKYTHLIKHTGNFKLFSNKSLLCIIGHAKIILLSNLNVFLEDFDTLTLGSAVFAIFATQLIICQFQMHIFEF